MRVFVASGPSGRNAWRPASKPTSPSTERMPGRGQYDRTQPARLRRREQRAKLLAAASRVFATTGYARASVEAVISHAGMSRRTFYEHFDDLHDVLLDLHERSATFAVAFVRGAIDAAPEPLAGVEAGIRAFVDLTATHADLARVLFREVRASGDDRRREALEDQFATLLLDALRRAHERGELASCPEPIAVTAIVGAIETVAMRMVEHRREAELPGVLPALLRITLGAFHADGKGAVTSRSQRRRS